MACGIGAAVRASVCMLGICRSCQTVDANTQTECSKHGAWHKLRCSHTWCREDVAVAKTVYRHSLRCSCSSILSKSRLPSMRFLPLLLAALPLVAALPAPAEPANASAVVGNERHLGWPCTKSSQCGTKDLYCRRGKCDVRKKLGSKCYKSIGVREPGIPFLNCLLTPNTASLRVLLHSASPTSARRSAASPGPC
jgi:hypothetical protein